MLFLFPSLNVSLIIYIYIYIFKDFQNYNGPDRQHLTHKYRPMQK